MKIYYAPTPNGMKPLLFLEEFKHLFSDKVEAIKVDLAKSEQFSDAFLRISVNNKIPALECSEITLFESGVILEYLADMLLDFKHDSHRYHILKWLYWQVGGLGPMGGQSHHFQTINEHIPYAIERYTKEINRLYSVLDKELAKNQYIGGANYHIADMAIYPWIWYHELHLIQLEAYKHVSRWFNEVKNKESVINAYRKYMEKQTL